MNQFSEVADGLAAWITYQQRIGHQAMFGESFLAEPIGALLREKFPGRVDREIPHPVLASLHVGAGKKPRIDYGVYGEMNRLKIAVEVKWLSGSRTLLPDIVRDLVRLDLLLPNYAAEGVLIVAGLKRNFQQIFRSPYFKANVRHYNSNTLLPIAGHPKTSVRFAPIPEFRRSLHTQVLKDFKTLEISRSIPVELGGPFPRGANASHHEVYVWRIRRHHECAKFVPAELYTFPSIP